MALGQVPDAAVKESSEQGIPVTDPLVKAKCGATCHASDERGNLQRISWARTTPEGWQDVLKRMILVNGLMVTPAEARTIVKYLSSANGLAPQEARPVMYDVERRIRDEIDIPTENLRTACAKCHGFARAMSWRRSAEDWKALVDSHATRYKIPTNDEAVAFLAKSAPLHTPEWASWSKSTSVATHASKLGGRWLVTASLPGHGKYYGEMEVEAGGSDDEFTTRVTLKSARDGSAIVRSGRTAVFGGYAWRGRSKGSAPGSAPDDAGSDAREVMWISADQSSGAGRWFWGQYQEFGFDVTLQRASTKPTLLGVDRLSLKIGSKANSVHLIGDNLPKATPADITLGPGVTVNRVVSQTPSEIAVEVDVASNATAGKRDVAVRDAVAPGGIAIYDRVDYVKVTPESSLAAFGDREHTRGYQQFEGIGYQRGADGKRHTADDVELGPVDVTWSMEIFYAPEGSATDNVGKVNSTGFFTPAAESPKNNFDIWIIAKAASEKDVDGALLVGKAYLVLTVPAYTFNGRRYVRDLDRWVDDGPARAAQ